MTSMYLKSHSPHLRRGWGSGTLAGSWSFLHQQRLPSNLIRSHPCPQAPQPIMKAKILKETSRALYKRWACNPLAYLPISPLLTTLATQALRLLKHTRHTRALPWYVCVRVSVSVRANVCLACTLNPSPPSGVNPPNPFPALISSLPLVPSD